MTVVLAESATRIDVQFHFSPPFYTELVKRTHHIATDRWSVEAALTYMDKNRIAAGILSVSTPGVDFLSPDEGVAMARRLNEAAADVVRSYPARFGSFATLPMRNVDAALAEIHHCFDTLKMDGVCLMSNVEGHYLGHEAFGRVFDELNRRRAVVFIHPTDPVGYGELQIAPVAEWPFDTCRAAIDLVYAGTIRRCPDLSIILAHAGGALPAVAPRVRGMSAFYSTATPPVMPGEAARQFASFYYDLAIAADPGIIGALRGLSSLDNVLFACDWPFAPDAAVAANVNGFEALTLTDAERHAIERGNADRLFPRLATA